MTSEDGIVPEPDVLQAMQDDPTLGGTLMALVSAVTRLVGENMALAERVSELGNLLEQRDGAEAAQPEGAAADVPPEDIPDAEFARLLHRPVVGSPIAADLPVAEQLVAEKAEDEDTAADYTALTEANW